MSEYQSEYGFGGARGYGQKSCAVKECLGLTAGKSKYCYNHRAESRQRFKQMCIEKAAEKEKRETLWREVFKLAHNTGEQAHLMSDADKRHKTAKKALIPSSWAVIRIPDGRAGVARWAKNYAGFEKGKKGVERWVLDRGIEYASAYAQVLKDNGITAYAQSRMD